MYKKRIGNDIRVLALIRQKIGEVLSPFDMRGRNISVGLVNPRGVEMSVPEFEIAGEDGGLLAFNFYGKDQRLVGVYTVVVRENDREIEMRTVDKTASFELVEHSYQENIENDGVITIEALEIAMDMAIGTKGDKGEQGPKGDKMTYADLTEADKADLYEGGASLIRPLLDGKQDTISDLETIRQGAEKGSTALQSESDPIYTADKPNLALKSELAGKVDKEEGKGLSSNDYTDAEKAKLTELVKEVKEARDNTNIIKEAALINDARIIEPTWNDGGYVNQKGNVVSDSVFYYSNPIKLIEGDIIKVYCRGTINVAILSITDELGESRSMVVKGTNATVNEYFTFEAVSECYVCISCIKSDTNEFKIFNNQINNKVSKNKNAINNLEKGALVLVKSRNIYNKETSVEGILRVEGNIQTSYSDFITSDYIAVKPNTNYVISGNNIIYCYGEFNGSTIIKYVASQSNLINIVTSPATNYIRLSYNKSFTGVQVEEGTEKTTYEAYDKPTIIQSDIEGRKVETSSEEQFEVEYSENLIIFETFTKNGYIKWDNSYSENTNFRTSNQVVPIEGGETYSHNLDFVSLRYYDDKMNYLGVQYNPASPFVVTSGAKYAEISLSTALIINRSGIIVKGETIPEDLGVGHFPYIKKILKTGMNVYANLADKTYVNINKWKGCKYASLGDSVTFRDHWQKIVDFHLGTTHKNLACSGMSVGGYAFHYTTGGSEDAVADRLLNADDFADCQFIIICGYANNWAGNGSELGTMADEFIKISEDSIASFSSVNDYRRIITAQTFIAACRSTVDYIQRIAPQARIILCGQLLMDSSYIEGWDANNINLHRKNGKGLDSTTYSEAMKGVAEYYSIPYVDLAKKGGVNDMNWNLYYSASDQIHPNFKDYEGGEDFPDSGMYKMARGIISMLGNT